MTKQAEALRKQLDTVRGVKDLFELGVRTGEVKNLDPGIWVEKKDKSLSFPPF